MLWRFSFLMSLLFFQISEVASQINYLNYHREILKAEQLFFIHQFDSSIHYYRDIFTRYPKPFAKDCFIALQFAGLRKDTASASFFFLKAFENGVKLEDLYKAKHIATLLSDVSYRNHVGEIYKGGRRSYLMSINRPLRDSINRMLKRDFMAKSLAVGYRDSNFIYHFSGKDVAIFDENLQTLIKLVKNYGYPGQHLIGLEDDELDSARSRKDYLFSSIADIILFHHTCGLYFLKKDLLKAIEKGELLPREYALIYQWAYDDYYQSKGQLRGGNTVWHENIKCDYPRQTEFYNNYLNPFFYSKDTAMVNKCRKEIAMESIQHETIKARFGRNNDIIFITGFMNKY